MRTAQWPGIGPVETRVVVDATGWSAGRGEGKGWRAEDRIGTGDGGRVGWQGRGQKYLPFFLLINAVFHFSL